MRATVGLVVCLVVQAATVAIFTAHSQTAQSVDENPAPDLRTYPAGCNQYPIDAVLTNASQLASVFDQAPWTYPCVLPWDAAVLDWEQAPWWTDFEQLSQTFPDLRTYPGYSVYDVTFRPIWLTRLVDTGEVIITFPWFDSELARFAPPLNYRPGSLFDQVLRDAGIQSLSKPKTYKQLLDAGYWYLDPKHLLMQFWLADINDRATYERNVLAQYAEALACDQAAAAAPASSRVATDSTSLRSGARFAMLMGGTPCTITNEDDAFVVLDIQQDENGYAVVTWESCSDHLYEVQAAPEMLTNTAWQAHYLTIGDDGYSSWTDTNTPAFNHRFYRVQRLTFTGDADNDGLSNLDEYNIGTNLHNPDTDGDGILDGEDSDPLDYYNGVPPVLSILSGDYQTGTPETFLPEPLVFVVKGTNGAVLANAPVTLAATTGGGQLALATNGAPLASALSLTTDSSGEVAAFLLLGASAGLNNVTASATSGAGSASATATATGGSGTCIEQAMRAVQERYFVSGLPATNYFSWPVRYYNADGAVTNAGGEAPGPYPTNGFYCYDLKANGESNAVALIQVIAGKLADDSFINRFVAEIEGRSNLVVHSTHVFTNSVIGLGDMPAVTNFSCGGTMATLDQLSAYIGKLNSFAVSASQVDKMYRVGYNWPAASSCQGAIAEADSMWAAGSWTPTGCCLIQMYDYTGRDEPWCDGDASGFWAGKEDFQGTVFADLTPFTAANASLYLRVRPFGDGTAHAPPVSADSLYHQYGSGSGGSTNTFGPFAADEPDWSSGCLDCDPWNDDEQFCEGYCITLKGWEMFDQLMLVSPTWQNSVGSCSGIGCFDVFHIEGTNKVCVGSTTTLIASPDGAVGWDSSDTNKATVAGGVVTGIKASDSVNDVTITATSAVHCVATYPITVVGVKSLQASGGSAINGPTNIVCWASNGVVSVTAKSQPELGESALPDCWNLSTNGVSLGKKLTVDITKTNPAIITVTAAAGSSGTNLVQIVAKMESITVISNATQYIVGSENWATVKGTNDVVAEVTTSPLNGEDIWQQVAWSGGVEVPGHKNQHKFSTGASVKTTVTASLGDFSQKLNLWVVWFVFDDFNNTGPTPSDSSVSPAVAYGAATGTRNGMLLGGSIFPTGFGAESGVSYDIKRTVEAATWSRYGAGWTQDTHVGPGEDDDPNDTDEDLTPSSNSHIYVADSPGFASSTAFADEAVLKLSAVEFVMIRFGSGPWMRCSDDYEWHSVTWLENDGTGHWQRKTSEPNEIAPGSITVGSSNSP